MTKKADSTRKRLTRRELEDLDVEISFLEGIVRRDPVFDRTLASAARLAAASIT